jgi:hypothetical protein
MVPMTSQASPVTTAVKRVTLNVTVVVRRSGN